jgi:hypothetical protein
MRLPNPLLDLDIWHKDMLKCWQQFQLYLKNKRKPPHHDKQRNNERH